MCTLAISVQKELLRLGWTLSVAESLTAGLVQSTLASVSGSSAYFAGGITAYNVDQKVQHLGINREHAQSVNCVSSRVAMEMARGILGRWGTDVAVSTTGYAEPWPDEGVEAPHAYFSIYCAHGGFTRPGWTDTSTVVLTKRIDFPISDSRETVRNLVTKYLLHDLLQFLRNVEITTLGVLDGKPILRFKLPESTKGKP